MGQQQMLSPQGSGCEDLQMQLMQSLQQVAEAARHAESITERMKLARAAGLSESAADFMVDAKEKCNQAEGLEARLRSAETQLIRAKEATNEYRLASREVLPERSVAEAKAQSLDLARDSFEMERDSASKSDSDLLMQTWQLQNRLKEL